MGQRGERPATWGSMAWGLAAGAAGGLCCLGPAVAALLGLGASSALAGAQLGRWPAAALGAALLALGAALAARRGAACGLGPAGRLRAPLLMLAAFGLSYALLAHGLPAAAAARVAAGAAAPAAAPAGELRRLTLSVEKMYCPPCAATVQRLLGEQPGVAAFVAGVDSDVVLVDYGPAQISAAAIVGLLPRSYGVTQLDDAPLARGARL